MIQCSPAPFVIVNLSNQLFISTDHTAKNNMKNIRKTTILLRTFSPNKVLPKVKSNRTGNHHLNGKKRSSILLPRDRANRYRNILLKNFLRSCKRPIKLMSRFVAILNMRSFHSKKILPSKRKRKGLLKILKK